jgi:mRNA-degrading endonuclease RelE of RelBE toxin-antitoxin system
MATAASPKVVGDGILPDTPAERDAKRLRKKYSSFDADLQREVAALNVRSCAPPDDAIPGFVGRVFKRRMRCSDMNEGKSGGYRLVYGVFPDGILFLKIFHKRERPDVDAADLQNALDAIAAALSPPASDDGSGEA